MNRVTPGLTLMVTSLVCGGCATVPAPRQAPVSHVVLFKLKLSADTAELIADCDARVPRIPGVAGYACGRPVDTGRAAVDSGYDVGLYVGFGTLDAYRSYLAHPDHQALVEKWKPRWEWIRIHDFLDPTP
jgi:hypothetical protein